MFALTSVITRHRFLTTQLELSSAAEMPPVSSQSKSKPNSTRLKQGEILKGSPCVFWHKSFLTSCCWHLENVPTAVPPSESDNYTSDTLNFRPTVTNEIANHHKEPQPHCQDQPPDGQARRVQPSRKNKGNIMASILQNMEVDDDATTSLPGRKRSRRVADDGFEDLANVPPEAPTNPLAPPNKKKRKQASLLPQIPMPPQMPLHPPKPVQTRLEHPKILSIRTGISGVTPVPASASVHAPAAPPVASTPSQMLLHPPKPVQTRSEHQSIRTEISGVTPFPASAASPVASATHHLAGNLDLFLPEPGWMPDSMIELDSELDPLVVENGFFFLISSSCAHLHLDRSAKIHRS